MKENCKLAFRMGERLAIKSCHLKLVKGSLVYLEWQDSCTSLFWGQRRNNQMPRKEGLPRSNDLLDEPRFDNRRRWSNLTQRLIGESTKEH